MTLRLLALLLALALPGRAWAHAALLGSEPADRVMAVTSGLTLAVPPRVLDRTGQGQVAHGQEAQRDGAHDHAEQQHVASGDATVDAAVSSTNPDVRRLLGVEGDLGKALGLDNRWAYAVIELVGNYGEVCDRSIAPLGIPRSLNQLWSKGGLQYSTPLR